MWGIILSPKNDYRDDIEALRRDVARIARAAAETEQRSRHREKAIAEQKRLQAELTPFLRHFDPEGTMKPSECLDRVQEWETEYRRMMRRIPELREELARFVAEKGYMKKVPRRDTLQGGYRDSNPGPSEPQSDALTSCAISTIIIFLFSKECARRDSNPRPTA